MSKTIVRHRYRPEEIIVVPNVLTTILGTEGDDGRKYFSIEIEQEAPLVVEIVDGQLDPSKKVHRVRITLGEMHCSYLNSSLDKHLHSEAVPPPKETVN